MNLHITQKKDIFVTVYQDGQDNIVNNVSLKPLRFVFMKFAVVVHVSNRCILVQATAHAPVLNFDMP